MTGRVEVLDGTYIATASNGDRLAVSLVNPDARRWQVHRQIGFREKTNEFDDWQLAEVVGLVFATHSAIARKLLQRVRRDHPLG